MTSEDVTFESQGNTLAGTIDWNAARDAPTVMSLHGGGESAKTRAAYLTAELAKLGHSCLRFDFAGQGQSGGDMRRSSLARRTREALDAVRFLDQSRPLTILATSMGGPTAVDLTKYLNVGSLVLFCPAIYAADAYDVPFDERLTTILRRKNSFLEADVAPLQNFTGHFLHVIGENDAVIPAGVTQMYKDHVSRAKQRDFVVIKDAPHNVHGWLKDHDEERRNILSIMTRHIN